MDRVLTYYHQGIEDSYFPKLFPHAVPNSWQQMIYSVCVVLPCPECPISGII